MPNSAAFCASLQVVPKTNARARVRSMACQLLLLRCTTCYRNQGATCSAAETQQLASLELRFTLGSSRFTKTN